SLQFRRGRLLATAKSENGEIKGCRKPLVFVLLPAAVARPTRLRLLPGSTFFWLCSPNWKCLDDCRLAVAIWTSAAASETSRGAAVASRRGVFQLSRSP